MESLIRKIIANHSRYLHDAELFENRLEARENPDMRAALTVLRIRIEVIESWFTLLDVDERFALRQLLTDRRDENSARYAAISMWLYQLCMENQSPWEIRERAIRKITIFSRAHKKMIQAVFNDLV